VAANERASAGLTYGDLGSTFGGGPVVCAAALANLEVLSDEGLCERAAVAGRALAAGARAIPGVSDVQGCGLLLGLRLDRPAASVQRALWGHHVLAGTSSDPVVLRLIPPLCVSDAEIERFLAALRKVMS
jgi:acetylornithine aminotransferase